MNQFAETAAGLNAAKQAGSEIVDGGKPGEESKEDEEHHAAHSGIVLPQGQQPEEDLCRTYQNGNRRSPIGKTIPKVGIGIQPHLVGKRANVESFGYAREDEDGAQYPT